MSSVAASCSSLAPSSRKCTKRVCVETEEQLVSYFYSSCVGKILDRLENFAFRGTFIQGEFYFRADLVRSDANAQLFFTSLLDNNTRPLTDASAWQPVPYRGVFVPGTTYNPGDVFLVLAQPLFPGLNPAGFYGFLSPLAPAPETYFTISDFVLSPNTGQYTSYEVIEDPTLPPMQKISSSNVRQFLRYNQFPHLLQQPFDARRLIHTDVFRVLTNNAGFFSYRIGPLNEVEVAGLNPALPSAPSTRQLGVYESCNEGESFERVIPKVVPQNFGPPNTVQFYNNPVTNPPSATTSSGAPATPLVFISPLAVVAGPQPCVVERVRRRRSRGKRVKKLPADTPVRLHMFGLFNVVKASPTFVKLVYFFSDDLGASWQFGQVLDDADNVDFLTAHAASNNDPNTDTFGNLYVVVNRETITSTTLPRVGLITALTQIETRLGVSCDVGQTFAFQTVPSVTPPDLVSSFLSSNPLFSFSAATSGPVRTLLVLDGDDVLLMSGSVLRATATSVVDLNNYFAAPVPLLLPAGPAYQGIQYIGGGGLLTLASLPPGLTLPQLLFAPLPFLYTFQEYFQQHVYHACAAQASCAAPAPCALVLESAEFVRAVSPSSLTGVPPVGTSLGTSSDYVDAPRASRYFGFDLHRQTKCHERRVRHSVLVSYEYDFAATFGPGSPARGTLFLTQRDYCAAPSCAQVSPWVSTPIDTRVPEPNSLTPMSFIAPRLAIAGDTYFVVSTGFRDVAETPAIVENTQRFGLDQNAASRAFTHVSVDAGRSWSQPVACGAFDNFPSVFPQSANPGAVNSLQYDVVALSESRAVTIYEDTRYISRDDPDAAVDLKNFRYIIRADKQSSKAREAGPQSEQTSGDKAEADADAGCMPQTLFSPVPLLCAEPDRTPFVPQTGNLIIQQELRAFDYRFWNHWNLPAARVERYNANDRVQLSSCEGVRVRARDDACVGYGHPSASAVREPASAFI